jgi:hypothetical protein
MLDFLDDDDLTSLCKKAELKGLQWLVRSDGNGGYYANVIKVDKSRRKRWDGHSKMSPAKALSYAFNKFDKGIFPEYNGEVGTYAGPLGKD